MFPASQGQASEDAETPAPFGTSVRPQVSSQQRHQFRGRSRVPCAPPGVATWGRAAGPARRAGTLGTLTADGVGAAGTLLGVQVAEAAQAVGELLPGREALAGQRLLAGRAHEALPVPGLLAVRDAPGGDGLEEARRPGSAFRRPVGSGWREIPIQNSPGCVKKAPRNGSATSSP